MYMKYYEDGVTLTLSDFFHHFKTFFATLFIYESGQRAITDFACQNHPFSLVCFN